MMPILVKGDVRKETKTNAIHSRLWLAQESMGSNESNSFMPVQDAKR